MIAGYLVFIKEKENELVIAGPPLSFFTAAPGDV
jgi:uncharacterized protein (DUF2237 family)